MRKDSISTGKTIFASAIIFSLLYIGGVILAGGGNYNNYSSYFNRSSGALILVNSTDTLGDTNNRISKIWLDDLDSTSLTVSGSSGGSLDMGGNAISNIGTVTATKFVATSTSEATTIVYRLAVATTTPQTDFVVNDITGTSTGAFLSDASGFGGEIQVQSPNNNCYSLTCQGLDASGCGWATSTCNK